MPRLGPSPIAAFACLGRPGHRLPPDWRDPAPMRLRRKLPLCKARTPLLYARGLHTSAFPGSSVVEQPAVNRLVAGSNPARGAKSTSTLGPKFRDTAPGLCGGLRVPGPTPTSWAGPHAGTSMHPLFRSSVTSFGVSTHDGGKTSTPPASVIGHLISMSSSTASSGQIAVVPNAITGKVHDTGELRCVDLCSRSPFMS